MPMRAGTVAVDAMSGVEVCCSSAGDGEEGGGVGSADVEAESACREGTGGLADGGLGAKTTRALCIRSASRSPTHFWAWM